MLDFHFLDACLCRFFVVQTRCDICAQILGSLLNKKKCASQHFEYCSDVKLIYKFPVREGLFGVQFDVIF